MKKLKAKFITLNFLIIKLIIIFFISKTAFSDEFRFEIKGNSFTDSNVILSLLGDIPDDVDEDYSNQIINILNNSNLFSEVSVNYIDNKFIIIIKEFPNIDKLVFTNNERLKDEELELVANSLNLTNYNSQTINLFIKEVTKIYESFGYNNVKIEYSKNLYNTSNTVDLIFNINEGEITKINKIIISGNDSILAENIRDIIKSKTKSIRNIFANNNFKPSTLERDKYIIANYYKNNGFLDVTIDTKIEYLKSNKVNIFFNIKEGIVYSLSSIKFSDENNILDTITIENIDIEVNSFLEEQNYFSIEKINQFEKEVSSIIVNSGIQFFELSSFEKIDSNNVEIVFKVSPILPKYTRQINIVGNSRTFDYVIRRELEIIEGDAIYQSQVKSMRDKLISLNLFEEVNIKEQIVDDNKIDLIIEVEEKQTGTFNAGVSVGTLDGFSIVTGLKERNFYGTGRSLDALVNTSQDKNQFKLITTDRLSYENDADISYSVNYKQQDFSNTSSYKLDTFSSGIGIGYKINKNLYHNIDLGYVLKDYKITDSSSVSSSISNSSGANAAFVFTNNFRYSTLNSGFIPRNGNYFNFNNSVETPTSSSNGYIKNLITLKKYYSQTKNIFSIQSRLGNIFSLNNNDILTDDKFSLGGRWLRGFDNFGAGPRNSRTSYVGGNNIFVSKFDYSYEITQNSNFPFYLNLFNDYGLLWDNKTRPAHSDNSLRSSAGFGIKYYSPIGPIGFTWGFPLMDKEYDINRMFLFSIGNID